MVKVKDGIEERRIIVRQPAKRPYGARVCMRLQTSGDIADADNVCVPLPSGAFLTIEPTHKAPWEGGKKYVVKLEGFSTAVAAEAAGRRLVQALLWMAVSTDVALKLEYSTYEPAAVFERGVSSGVGGFAYGEVVASPTVVFGELRDAYACLTEPDEKLLLSMEIFCSARLELSQRATFLALVSALEPLANQQMLGTAVTALVEQFVDQLRCTEGITTNLKMSLEQRVIEMRRESVRQALRRMVLEALPENADAWQIIDDAYALRSQLIHTGVPSDLDVDLERECRTVSRTVRALYSSLLKRPLARGTIAK